MTTRFCSPQRVNALKTAFKRVVDDLGGVDAAASCSRVGRAQISDYGNIEKDRMPPIDVVMDFEHLTGQRHVTEAMRTMLDESRTGFQLADVLSRISIDNGKLIADALRGAKKISPKQRDAMLTELRDMSNAVSEAITLLQKGYADEADEV